MNHESIRRIDYHLGRPICAVLTVCRKLRDGMAPSAYATPRSLLFIKLIEQGATVSAHDAICEAVARLGRDKVYFLVFHRNREIVSLLNLLPEENIHSIRNDSLVHFTLDILRALWRFRRIGIDATVDMEFFARASAIIAMLSGARWRVGLHRFRAEGPYRGDLMTHRVQHNPYINVALHYRALVDAVFETPSHEPMRKVAADLSCLRRAQFQPCPEEQEALGRRFEMAGMASAPVVVLNPNAHDSLLQRKWPLDKFVALAHRIAERWPDAVFVLTGLAEERAGVDKMAAGLAPSRTINVAGRTSLRDLLTLYGLAHVLVTNDSGPAHFASMTDVRTVALFGPETPTVFAPLGPHVTTIHKGLLCSPCVNPFNHRFSPCTDNQCMQQIEVEEVLAAVGVALAASGFCATGEYH